MGVTVQEPVGTAARAPHTHRRQGLVALGLLTVVSLGLSALGVGTGAGPLAPKEPTGRYGVAMARDVGGQLTEGNTLLVNRGLLTAQVESIRLIPVGDATEGMSITAIELVPTSRPLIGAVDGPGFELIAPGVRSSPAGYPMQPERTDGRPGSAELLVRAEVTKPGDWRYRGYEVVYRSGFVRHRMVVDAEIEMCTPLGATCPAHDG